MAIPSTYKTLEQPSEGLYKEKGSKFLAFAYPLLAEDDIKNRLDELRKNYADARHHCYAYLLGTNQEKYRANDDGEPSNSAGIPILNQIKSFGLTNVLVVVVRYFGGTKLGVSGLVNAYKTAAQAALQQGQIIEKYPQRKITLQYDYSHTSLVKQLSKQFELVPVEQLFEQTCRTVFYVKEHECAALEANLKQIQGIFYTI